MSRDTLRIILLVGGVALIGAIYLFEIWRKKRRAQRRVPFMLDPGTEQAPASGYREPSEDDFEAPYEAGEAGVRVPPAAEPAQMNPPLGTRTMPAARESASVGRRATASATGDALFADQPDDAYAGESGVPPLQARSGEAEQLGLDGLSVRTEGAGAQHASPADDVESLLLVLNVLAADGQRMHGSRLVPVFERHGLALGSDGVFHAPPATDGQPAFSVLSAVNPGVFEPDKMSDLWTPGIALFAPVGPMRDPAEAFELLLTSARELADELEGRVCDEHRHQLTAQSENHLREQMREQSRRRRLAAGGG